MTLERSQLIEFLRGELVGPVRSASFHGGRPRFEVTEVGPVVPHPQSNCFNAWLYWRPEGAEGDEEEILSIRDGNNPHRAYGVGVLHPAGVKDVQSEGADDDENGQNAIGADQEGFDEDLVVVEALNEDADADETDEAVSTSPDIDIEIISPDANRPSSMAISFCVMLEAAGELIVSLPRSRRLSWQTEDQPDFALNGFYERFQLRLERKEGQDQDPLFAAWRRRPAVPKDAVVVFPKPLLVGNTTVAQRTIAVPKAPGIPEGFRLNVQAYPRERVDGSLLVTLVLRNQSGGDLRAMALFQSHFEVEVAGGMFLPYPESERPFAELDKDEQSMELLYRNTRCWAIGHGCAAGWADFGGERPKIITADVLPTVELPSMTPDIELNGEPLSISMSALSVLPDPDVSRAGAWSSLDGLIESYAQWIEQRRHAAQDLEPDMQRVADRHLIECGYALERMKAGVDLLRSDPLVRKAFRWANEAMLLQQISLKHINRRELRWSAQDRRAVPEGHREDPFTILDGKNVKAGLGHWRAFQIAFLLMSLRGMVQAEGDDRETVDLVWFPTGGGKTEAYLGVAAFQMFHQRLQIPDEQNGALRRDGTTVLMRYTLRMLTTDQFQRAASLICGMEAIRQREANQLKGDPFRLGLWLGRAGSPNKIEDAKERIAQFASDREENAGNPLVLTDCPWCRAAIGRLGDESKPLSMKRSDWNNARLGGLRRSDATMRCPDVGCLFGGDTPLPVDVIDESIYQTKPSMVIGTADKFAMLAYEPRAGSLFGRCRHNGEVIRTHRPPSLIIQDELHLISGPLGTLFGLYETIFNDLCTIDNCSPKIISSTATVRGADQQVQALFARGKTALFPPPGLDIADSFFGKYARDPDGSLSSGRLYVGIHALYGSLQTTQARVFAAVLARATTFDDSRKDPWWTLLAYYNSMRELSGARTLFDSDIQSRLKHLAGREGMRPRHLSLEELSARLSQAQIVALKDRLAKRIETGSEADRVDACLSSNIIEVGVDIERLSLMTVVGQPKSTASYIQASGRVGRKWWERPGLILTLLNPRKSRDASHFEQFHTYHRRLYERVEPTSATPFSLSALQRGLVGAMLAHVRQQVAHNPDEPKRFEAALASTATLFRDRIGEIGMEAGDRERSSLELERLFKLLVERWDFFTPKCWNDWNQPADVFPLMLVPGKFANGDQKRRGFEVPTSLRQVDAQAELSIDYFEQDFPG